MRVDLIGIFLQRSQLATLLETFVNTSCLSEIKKDPPVFKPGVDLITEVC